MSCPSTFALSSLQSPAWQWAERLFYLSTDFSLLRWPLAGPALAPALTGLATCDLHIARPASHLQSSLGGLENIFLLCNNFSQLVIELWKESPNVKKINKVLDYFYSQPSLNLNNEGWNESPIFPSYRVFVYIRDSFIAPQGWPPTWQTRLSGLSESLDVSMIWNENACHRYSHTNTTFDYISSHVSTSGFHKSKLELSMVTKRTL